MAVSNTRTWILELELKASLVYSFKDTSNDLCPGLRIHGVAIFDSNKHRQRDRTCLPPLTEVVEGLISSLPRRVQAVIDAKGWHTKY